MKKTHLTKPAGELALIAALRTRRQHVNAAVRLGIGDDCAIIRPRIGEDFAITTDFSLENVHFRRDWHPPESVGHRCLARGLSDLAAMGARPVAAFLSIAIPTELTVAVRKQETWLQRFLNGLLTLAEKSNVTLAGGDTAQAPAIAGKALVAADIILLGSVENKRALVRSGARAGDRIYVTGSLGGAAAELLAIERNPLKFRQFKLGAPHHPHLYPEPRVVVGRRLAGQQLASACIDVSDGLSTDLRHLCEESGVAAVIDASALPIHPMADLAQAAGWTDSALELALHGGEDYELLFTAPPSIKVPKKIAGISMTAIGTITKTSRNVPVIKMIRDNGAVQSLQASGWEHFRK
jgi:thiamine-monophosphate kinase